MVSDSESRVLEKVDQHDHSNELRISTQRKDFMGEVKDLRAVTKERHVLFVQEVKKVREDVNMQIRELLKDMQKEVLTVQQDYASANQKIDIICNAVTRCVKLFEDMTPQLSTLSAKEEQNFGELVNLLKELKDLSTRPVTPIISQEFLSQKFVQFEAILHKQLAPLLRISSLLPTVSDAPPVVTGVQGGEKKNDQSKAGEQVKPCEGVKTATEDSKVVSKVFPSKVTSNPTVVSAAPVTSTMVTTVPISKPVMKGVVIGNPVEDHSKSKVVVSSSKDNGKGIIVEKSKEEKKAEGEAEVEKMR